MWTATKTAPGAINIFTKYRMRKGSTITYEDNGTYIRGYVHSSRNTKTKGIMYKVCPPSHCNLDYVGNDVLLNIPASRIVCSSISYYTLGYLFIERPDMEDLVGTVVSAESSIDDNTYMGLMIVEHGHQRYRSTYSNMVIQTLDGVINSTRFQMIYSPEYLPESIYVTSTPPDPMVADTTARLSDKDSPLVERRIRSGVRILYINDSEVAYSYIDRSWHTKAEWKYRLTGGNTVVATRILSVRPSYYSIFSDGYVLPDGTWVDFHTGSYSSATYHRGQIYSEDNRMVLVSNGLRHIGLSSRSIDRVYMNGGEEIVGTYPDGP